MVKELNKHINDQSTQQKKIGSLPKQILRKWRKGIGLGIYRYWKILKHLLYFTPALVEIFVYRGRNE